MYLFLMGILTLSLSSCTMNDDELLMELHATGDEIDDPVEPDREDN